MDLSRARIDDLDWLAGKAGSPVRYRHHACGEITHVDLSCDHGGAPMSATDIDVLPGPGAPASTTAQAVNGSLAAK
jgi:hypothetical protein